MDAETFFIEHLAEIRRAVAFVCRRNDLDDVEGEDLLSEVVLKLVLNDYEAIKKFEGRCSFRAYVLVVAERLLLDERNHELGKWRPSADARRLGERAMHLEMLLHRDKQPLDQAVQSILSCDSSVSRRELEQLAARLPNRWTRPRRVRLDPDSSRVAVSSGTVAAEAEAAERASLARKTAEVLRDAVGDLSEEDQVILRMRFEADMSVAEIARSLRIPQKPIYRLLNRHLKRFRCLLEKAGIDARDADNILEFGSSHLEFGLTASHPLPPPLSGRGESGED